MPGLKQYQKLDTIDSAYLDKTIVYLESEEDVQIIKERWFFDEGRFVEFKSVDSGVGGGCGQVISRVGFDRRRGVNAFGIVDRDALLQYRLWDLWWEKDDAVLAAGNPWGEHIKILKKWEIENYLLSPNEIEIVLADKYFRSLRPIDEVLIDINQQAENVKVLSAAAIYCHENGEHFPNEFGTQKAGMDLLEETTKYLKKRFGDSVLAQLNGVIDKIEAFAEGITSIDKNRWEKLSRLIDGKRMLRRMRLYDSSSNDRRGELARHIRINENIDSEIVSLLKFFKEEAKR